MDEIKLTKEEQNIIDSAKEVSLSMSEKNDIKNNLISYTNSHPISVPKKTSIFTFDYIYHRSVYLVPAIAVVLLVIGLNTTDNNSGQIASIETVDTSISEGVPGPEAFSTMSAPAGSIESASFAEPATADEPSNTRMMKSAPSAQATLFATADVSTTTATSSSSKKSSVSVSKIKNQINETYKNFISKFFSRNKNEDKNDKKQEDRDEKKEEIVSKKEDVRKKSEDSNSDDDEYENENEYENEDDDKYEDKSRDDDMPVVDPLPPIMRATTTTTTTTTVPGTSVIASYTLLQVALHNKSTDCWSVVSGGVYNLTSWIAKHPGGESAIKGMCGVDGTVGFIAQHNGDTKAVNTLSSYKIGILK